MQSYINYHYNIYTNYFIMRIKNGRAPARAGAVARPRPPGLSVVWQHTSSARDIPIMTIL